MRPRHSADRPSIGRSVGQPASGAARRFLSRWSFRGEEMVTVAAPARPKLATPSALILAGIVSGASVWGIYGILEYVFYTLTLVRSENSILTHEFWAANAMLVGSYIAVGAVIGFALALLLGATTSHKLAIVGFLTAATLTVSQITHYVILMGKITPIVGLLLICLLGQ